MEKKDQERISETFQQGTSNFTEADLAKVMKDEEKKKKKASKLGEQFKNFILLWDLLKDYYKGNYKTAPWKLIASIGFAVVYLVSPLDVIPDILPVVGFVDDTAVFAMVVAAFQADINAYKEWKKNH